MRLVDLVSLFVMSMHPPPGPRVLCSLLPLYKPMAGKERLRSTNFRWKVCRCYVLPRGTVRGKSVRSLMGLVHVGQLSFFCLSFFCSYRPGSPNYLNVLLLYVVLWFQTAERRAARFRRGKSECAFSCRLRCLSLSAGTVRSISSRVWLEYSSRYLHGRQALEFCRQ